MYILIDKAYNQPHGFYPLFHLQIQLPTGMSIAKPTLFENCRKALWLTFCSPWLNCLHQALASLLLISTAAASTFVGHYCCFFLCRKLASLLKWIPQRANVVLCGRRKKEPLAQAFYWNIETVMMVLWTARCLNTLQKNLRMAKQNPVFSENFHCTNSWKVWKIEVVLIIKHDAGPTGLNP